MWLTAVSTHGQSLRGAPDGQEDAHANHSQLNKDTLQESRLLEPEVSWVGTATSIRSPVLCRHRGRHVASWGESSNTYRCQGPEEEGDGLSSG